jgi:exopolyphosphatase/pppGpp-phosphohydrolase
MARQEPLVQWPTCCRLQDGLEEVITREGLDWLKEKLIKAGRVETLRLEGVREDRKPVIGGGLAVLCALFRFDANSTRCMLLWAPSTRRFV